jgi:hypothetical protein
MLVTLQLWTSSFKFALPGVPVGGRGGGSCRGSDFSCMFWRFLMMTPTQAESDLPVGVEIDPHHASGHHVRSYLAHCQWH